MNKKCSKYESLFIFSDEKTLDQHIEECEDCKIEHENMQKVSGLIGEVAFYYRAKEKRKRKLRAICAALCLIIFSTTFCMVKMDADLTDALTFQESMSAEDFGFPVDSYGLIMVD